MIDSGATPQERDRRSLRLTKGPLEFRDDRIDQPNKNNSPGRLETDQTGPGLLNCKLNLSLRYADCASFLTVGGMMRSILVAVLCAALAACTGADSYAFYPAFMRDAQPEAAAPEKPPPVGEIVREQLDSVFTTNSFPRNVQASAAHRDPRALDWIACVKAEVTSANGKPIGVQTYRVTIVDRKIVDRRRSDDNCSSENYQPI
jgi:hypothetical protein